MNSFECFILYTGKGNYFECALIDIVITCFIKYKLDEFELNWMMVYVWYDVVSMFVNDIWNGGWDIVSSRKEIPILRLLEYAMFGDLI